MCVYLCSSDDILLEDIDESITDYKFRLIPVLSNYCLVTYCDDTLASIIIRETLEKLNILYNNIDQYELIVLNDDRTEIDFEISIDDIRQLFSSSITAIPFELRKKMKE